MLRKIEVNMEKLDLLLKLSGVPSDKTKTVAESLVTCFTDIFSITNKSTVGCLSYIEVGATGVEKKVALYNKDYLSEKSASFMISSGEKPDNMIHCSEDTFEHVFDSFLSMGCLIEKN